jgi:hypothetical protein
LQTHCDGRRTRRETMELFDLISGRAVNLLASLLTIALGIGVLVLVVLFVLDITQTKDAIRRNYPVVGRFRYLFTTLGEFFRQYFFAMDREEMPFNRAERDWVYRSAEGVDNTVAFGSTRNLSPVGTAIFVNTPYPVRLPCVSGPTAAHPTTPSRSSTCPA